MSRTNIDIDDEACRQVMDRYHLRSKREGQQRREGYGRLDPAKTFTLERHLSPQVHRWAAARHAESREGVAGVLPLARRMDSRHGAAAMLGLIDATENLGEAEALEVLELAAGWPAPAVRLAAFQRLAKPGTAKRGARPRRRRPCSTHPPVGHPQPADQHGHARRRPA